MTSGHRGFLVPLLSFARQRLILQKKQSRKKGVPLFVLQEALSDQHLQTVTHVWSRLNPANGVG